RWVARSRIQTRSNRWPRPFLRACSVVADDRVDDIWNELVLPGDENRPLGLDCSLSKIGLARLRKTQVGIKLQQLRQCANRMLWPQAWAMRRDCRSENCLGLRQSVIDKVSAARCKQAHQCAAALPATHHQFLVILIAMDGHALYPAVVARSFGMADQHDFVCRHDVLSK